MTFSPKEKKLSRLSGLKSLPKKSWEKYFAFEDNGNIFFLSTDSQTDVIRYSINEQNFRPIKQSRINREPAQFVQTSHGCRIGNTFWVIFGETFHAQRKF